MSLLKWPGVTVIKLSLYEYENNIDVNFYRYNLLYPTCMVYGLSYLFCMCVGAYNFDCTYIRVRCGMVVALLMVLVDNTDGSGVSAWLEVILGSMVGGFGNVVGTAVIVFVFSFFVLFLL